MTIKERLTGWVLFWYVGTMTFVMVMVVMFVVLLVGVKACVQVVTGEEK